MSLNLVMGELDLESLEKLNETSDMIKQLLEIRGVGVWTAELAVLRGLGRFDAMPADDLGLRRIISQFYCENKKINAQEARDIAQSWGRWPGLAAYYLIVADLLSFRP